MSETIESAKVANMLENLKKARDIARQKREENKKKKNDIQKPEKPEKAEKPENPEIAISETQIKPAVEVPKSSDKEARWNRLYARLDEIQSQLATPKEATKTRKVPKRKLLIVSDSETSEDEKLVVKRSKTTKHAVRTNSEMESQPPQNPWTSQMLLQKYFGN
jgi:hypothetical protein